MHSDGILLLEARGPEPYVAALRIFNPDGSEAELSGNGVREAVLYLRAAGWTDPDTFTITTAAGEITPTLTGPESARVAMGRATTTSKDFPDGGTDGAAASTSAAASASSSTSRSATRSARSRSTTASRSSTCRRSAPRSSQAPIFPNRTNVSFWRRTARGPVGRGSSSAASARPSRRGPARRALRSRPSCAACRARSRSCSTAATLEVEISANLDVQLTGTAEPVFRGEFDPGSWHGSSASRRPRGAAQVAAAPSSGPKSTPVSSSETSQRRRASAPFAARPVPATRVG